MLALLLLLSSPACELASKSIVSHSASGLAQVSNLGAVEMKCSVPARPFPSKPGQFRSGLKVATTAYRVSQGGGKKWVPSEVQVSGGGFGPNGGPAWVNFSLLIPPLRL